MNRRYNLLEKDSYYYYRMGEESFNKNEIEHAIQYYLESVKLRKHYKTYERLYECCNCINQKDIANYFIRLAYEENNSNDKVSFLYSKYLVEQNKLNEAKQILLEIMERNPSYKQAKMEYEKLINKVNYFIIK